MSPLHQSSSLSTQHLSMASYSGKESLHEGNGLASKYVLPKCKVPPMSELKKMEEFVTRAIKSQNEGSEESVDHKDKYNGIIIGLRKGEDPYLLYRVFVALRTAECGSILTEITSNQLKYAYLIHMIMKFDSTHPPVFGEKISEEEAEKLRVPYYDCTLLDAQLHLILAIVSAKSVNLVAALTAIWKMLTKNIDLPDKVVYRLHAMVANMMRLIPKARSDFFPILSAGFPFWQTNTAGLVWYCTQSFAALDYLPSMRKQLLELVIDKCLEMDVHIKIKANGDVCIEQDQKDDDKKGEDGVEDGKVSKPSGNIEEAVDELSEKLDLHLSLLLNEIKKACTDYVSVRELYYEILPIFESTILTTHKAKFVQYCVFLLCGMESKILDEDTSGQSNIPNSLSVQDKYQHAILHRDFAAKLLEIIVDPYRATMTRQSGACYLASLISRGSFVGPETVCESVSALLRWAEAYIESVVSVRAADIREQSELHSLFYTVCQAAFYIMSFRGPSAIRFYRELLEGNASELDFADEDENIFLPDPEHLDLGTERWTRICSHELQPLRFCLESVRSEFLHVAHAYELIDEQALDKLVVEAKRLSTGRVNKKAASSIRTAATLQKKRRKGGVGGLGRGSNPLKSFFPFDPLLLRRSNEFIEPFYKYWQGPCEEDDVLVIDEDGDEQTFETDENMSQSDDEGDFDDDEDRLPVVVSDHDTRDEDESDSDEEMRTPTAQEKKNMQRMAWTEAFKRPRSLSIENGSW